VASAAPSRIRADPNSPQQGERAAPASESLADRARKRERRQGCQRLDRSWHRGKKTPTLAAPAHTTSVPRLTTCLEAIRRSGLGCRETPGPPVKPRGAQTPRGAHAAKVAEANAGNARGAGARSSYEVADVNRTHRASFSSGGRKASWRRRALAGRKLEAPLTRGTGGEKAKRYARSFVLNRSREHGLRVSACRFTR